MRARPRDGARADRCGLQPLFSASIPLLHHQYPHYQYPYSQHQYPCCIISTLIRMVRNRDGARADRYGLQHSTPRTPKDQSESTWQEEWAQSWCKRGRGGCSAAAFIAPTQVVPAVARPFESSSVTAISILFTISSILASSEDVAKIRK